jgi:undecaprenyl phosphate-alpha-L-ara4N flippase subunit ArnE
VIGLALVAACVAIEAMRELCFKLTANPLASAAQRRDWRAATAIAPLWLGLAAWAIEMLLWVLTLQHLPLALAFPLMAASFAAVPFAGWLVLHERLAPVQVAGMALVVGGVACVGLSGF